MSGVESVSTDVAGDTSLDPAEYLSEYEGCGELPDALAFINPSRSVVYHAIDQADGITAPQLVEKFGTSRSTIDRSLDDLDAIGLLESRHQIRIDGRRNCKEYHAKDPSGDGDE